MSEEDKHFIKRYEELLDKGYCDCNEMNCIDNNSPRRILNIVKVLQTKLQQEENIIKEVREYITYWHYRNDFRINSFTTGVKEELLEILDKKVN